MVRCVLYYAAFQDSLGRVRRVARMTTLWKECTVKDQDFFFDEEEKQTKKTGSKQQTKKSSDTSEVEPAPLATTLPLNIALLAGVIVLLLGIVIGLFVGQGMTAEPTLPIPAGGVAPELSQDQLNNGIPQDSVHKGLGGGSTAATGTK